MSEYDSLYLQGLKIGVETLVMEVARLRQEVLANKRHDNLPEWMDLEQAVALKRGVCFGRKRAPRGSRRGVDEPAELGASLSTYKQKPFLQPCCGKGYCLIGGRRCWKREDVIAWLSVTDEELSNYANAHGTDLPAVYEMRGQA